MRGITVHYPASSMHPPLSIRLAALSAFVLPLGAQNLFTYTNGQNHSGSLTTTPPDPLLLSAGTGVNATQSGTISGSGGITKDGAGTLTLTSANDHTGGTILNAGTLGLGGDNVLGSGTLTINGGTLRAVAAARTIANDVVLNGDFTLGRLTNLSGPVSLANNITLTSANPDTSGATTSTISGVISGNYGLSFANGANPIGTIVLTGNNTYTGDTTIHSGTLQIGMGGSSGSIAGNIINNGTLVFNRSDNFSIPGAISGTGSLIKQGAGTLTLGSAGSFTGSTTIQAGTLALGASGLLSDTAALTVGYETTLDLAGFDETVGSLSGSSRASVRLGSGTLTVGGNNASTTFNGTISGTGGLIKTGTGTLTLLYYHTYTGDTTISGGTLQIGSGYASGGVAGNIVNNSALVFSCDHWYGFSRNISGSGSVAFSGSGPTDLAGTNTYSGGTILNSGSLGLDSNQAIGTGTLTINGGMLRAVGMPRTISNNVVLNGDFTLGRMTNLTGPVSLTKTITITSANPSPQGPATSTISGIISGAYGLTFKDGANPTGAMILSGANTYTGATIVSSGTLFVNGSLGDTAVTVNSGATLGGSGVFGGITTIESGGHLAPGNSPGTITFTNGLTLNSGAVLDFQLGTVGDLILVTGGTLSGPVSGQITFNLANAGGFTEGTYTLIDWTGASTDNFTASDFILGSRITGYSYSFAMNGSTIQLTAIAVPEPASATLLGLATLGLAFYRRRA
jgi:fibronectin-binding autotransporter adhesin